MEAGTIFYSAIPWKPKQPFPRNPSSFPRFIRASASSQSQGGYRGPKPSQDLVADWVMNNDDAVRSLPIYVGGASLLAVLFNRTVSGIAPVADASRAWESLSAVTCCRSLVVVYDGICLLQIGMAAESGNSGEAVIVDASKLTQGSVYLGVMRSKAQRYLANLLLYPGRSELPFLPSNTQAVILQPLGDKGIAIIGGDTIRGFTTSDQSWIAFIGEKLDATLAKYSNIVPSMVQEGI
ncbi:protein COFACTOR ASSEMBLY OF COMPLEX C SUBUNIT B CCB4, chloroplastic isoform X3 [Citrus sinensis]|uniref:protein COFACTOR ASSEMBLY OF COMPLEX C SUBUNIT B CCB4, chloroplastic isoform X3 n=1 Tax=Citrus sinensis TaxID=2711 RepID=UPI0022784FC7|nr:protein COFACTOR ASSEMBLY OF COMPLEX C SUBUNIT B CCB4, chloroplastic isoform X3 [Citrus sinensis]